MHAEGLVLPEFDFGRRHAIAAPVFRARDVRFVAIDFGKLGTISAQQAVKILKNNIAVEDIPVETASNYSLIVNLTAAQRIGLVIPIQVLRSARKIIR